MVLIGLLYNRFIDNLSNFPSHIIHVRKQDINNIESIHFYYDYSGIDLINSTTFDLSRLVKLSKIKVQILFIIHFLLLIFFHFRSFYKRGSGNSKRISCS